MLIHPRFYRKTLDKHEDLGYSSKTGDETIRKEGTKTGLKRLCLLQAAVAVCLLMPGLIIGCGKNSSGSTNQTDAGHDVSRAGEIVSESEESVTVIDQAGREVTVPRGVESIAMSYRVVARFVITLGDGDKIRGIGKTEEFLYTLAPALKEAVDVGKGVPDLEQIAELAPDLYLHRATDVDGLEAVQKLGIPAIGLSFETPEEMKTALTILGAVLDKKERAAELTDYYDKKIEADREEAEEIADKKTAIVMGSRLGKVADGSMLQSEMIELAGGENAAADIKATELWPTAGSEQIFEWDPDYIFITGSEDVNYTIDELKKDKAWSELKAVQEDHIYLMPADKDSWEFPGVVSVLGIDYMKSKMYPEQLSEEQLQQAVDEFYQLSYGRTFRPDEIGY